jgi:hypothetical protein
MPGIAPGFFGLVKLVGAHFKTVYKRFALGPRILAQHVNRGQWGRNCGPLFGPIAAGLRVRFGFGLGPVCLIRRGPMPGHDRRGGFAY